MPKNLFTLKREILKTLGISLTYVAEWRLRKINYDGLYKIQHDHDVMNLKHENRVEAVHKKSSNEPKKSYNVPTGHRLGR